MRRRALLVAGVCALLGLTGAGVAAATSFSPSRPQIAAAGAPQQRRAHDFSGAAEPGASPAGGRVS